MVGCRLVRPDGRLDHACKRGFPTPASALAYFTGLSRLFPRSRRFGVYTASHVDADADGDVDAINGAFMLVSRSAVNDVGGLDEDFWLYAEDLDWCYRFKYHGWRVYYTAAATVIHHKGGSSTGGRRLKANTAFHRGMWIFYRKHYANDHALLTNAAVWLAIWVKLGASIAKTEARSLSGRRTAA